MIVDENNDNDINENAHYIAMTKIGLRLVISNKKNDTHVQMNGWARKTLG